MKWQYMFMVVLALLLSLSLPLPLAAQEEMPLAERGSYHVSERTLTFVDETRDGREIEVRLMYPALVPQDRQEDLPRAEQSHFPIRDLAPDMSGAPYPVVLYSYWYQGFLGEARRIVEPMVSHGFVMAQVDHPNKGSALTYIDRPLDILFVINQLAALDEATGGDLAGLMNTDMVGVMGADDGGDAAMMLTGARLDPEGARYVEELWGIESRRSIYPDWDWAVMAAYHDRFVPPTPSDPLLPATTDPRIRAVVAYDTHEGGLMQGERGLAYATVPTLLFGETHWGGYDGTAAAYLYSGAAEHYLFSLLTGDGEPYIDPNAAIVRQFATAFLGYHLQGKTEYAEFLTQDYAASLEDVVWGVDESAITDPQFVTELTFTDAGTVTVGDTLSGEITEPGERIGYSLTLDAAATLNLYANVIASFDTVLYVVDEQGNALFWNDEVILDDSLASAGFEGLALPAGSYTLVVSGFGHRMGYYDLVVESAE